MGMNFLKDEENWLENCVDNVARFLEQREFFCIVEKATLLLNYYIEELLIITKLNYNSHNIK